MKKVKFSLAVVTIAAMMVSCSGNKTNSSEDTDSVIIEVDEPVSSGQTIEARDFTLVMPQGWTIEDMASSFLKIRKDVPGKLPKMLWFLPYPKYLYSAEQKRNNRLSMNIEKAKDPVTLSGKTWYVLYKEPEGDDKGCYYYYVDLPNSGYMQVQAMNGYSVDDQEVKAILQSIKFK